MEEEGRPGGKHGGTQLWDHAQVSLLGAHLAEVTENPTRAAYTKRVLFFSRNQQGWHWLSSSMSGSTSL